MEKYYWFCGMVAVCMLLATTSDADEMATPPMGSVFSAPSASPDMRSGGFTKARKKTSADKCASCTARCSTKSCENKCWRQPYCRK